MIPSKSSFKIVLLLVTILLTGMSKSPKYITESEEYHVVKENETLYSISEKYDISVDDLKRINNLSSDTIYVGQKIYLQEKKTPYQYYVTQKEIPKSGYHIVKKGETLYRISKLYGVALENIMEFNQLSSYTIMPGDKIWLQPPPPTGIVQSPQVHETKKPPPPSPPSTEKIPSPKPQPTPPPRQNVAPKYHIVQKGETLYRIAKKYDMSVYELKRYNNLTDNNIYPGQKLFLTQQTIPETAKYTQPLPLPSNAKKYGMLWPCKGTITAGFGTNNGNTHKGIDIACPTGTPIKAVMDGEVAYTGWQRGYGNVIILKHDHGIMTVYAHNNENLVIKGEKVQKGEKIATVGNTGNSTGPHLHFEVRLEGRAMNPIAFLP